MANPGREYQRTLFDLEILLYTSLYMYSYYRIYSTVLLNYITVDLSYLNGAIFYNVHFDGRSL